MTVSVTQGLLFEGVLGMRGLLFGSALGLLIFGDSHNRSI